MPMLTIISFLSSKIGIIKTCEQRKEIDTTDDYYNNGNIKLRKIGNIRGTPGKKSTQTNKNKGCIYQYNKCIERNSRSVDSAQKKL